MARYYYMVYVDVPDDNPIPSVEGFPADEVGGGVINVTGEEAATIVMEERIHFNEDYGFEYAVDYSPLPAGKYGMEI